jgi:bifunctional non-homologous end joining protein LigD
MPRHVVPMKARTGELPADEDAHGFELKWDGVRAVVYVEDGRLTVESRTLADITARYPELAGLPDALGCRQVVLDGEIAAFDEDGKPSFQLLQGRLNVGSPAAQRVLAAKVPVTYIAFDVLHLEGRSAMALPYEQRRRLLEGLEVDGRHWQAPAFHRGDGASLLGVTRAQGLEGLVAKRLDSPYTPGRRPGSWVKIKNRLRQELVVGGWCPGEGSRQSRFGALMVGYYEEDEDGTLVLRYAGNVGTGFTEVELARLQRLLDERRRDDSPFTPPPPRKRARFVDPDLVAEVEFRQWTREGTLRQPSYKGLRDDKDPREVRRET